MDFKECIEIETTELDSQTINAILLICEKMGIKAGVTKYF